MKAPAKTYTAKSWLSKKITILNIIHKKIIILSDILEMGNSKEEIYNDLGYFISKLDIFELVLYGSEIKDLKNQIENSTIIYK